MIIPWLSSGDVTVYWSNKDKNLSKLQYTLGRQGGGKSIAILTIKHILCPCSQRLNF